MFKINDYIVYKKDVCKIIDIKIINDLKHYLLIPILDKSLKITIPIDNNNIKEIIKKNDALKLINNISNITPLDTINDNNIENQYKELIYNGTHEDLVKIIKTTYLRNNKRINDNKKISEKDNHYFNLAEKYLYSELSISLNKSFDETKQFIIDKLDKKNKII